MSTFNELEILVSSSIKKNQLTAAQEKLLKKELTVAKRFYENGRDLLSEFETKKEKIQTRYVLPFVLGYTNEITQEKPEYIQVKLGSSGGIDIDSDFQGAGKEKIIQHLKTKYGEDCVIPVGTFSTLGISNAVKDLLRIKGVEFQASNDFTAALNKEVEWSKALEELKLTDQKQYKFYQKNQEILDLVPKFLNKTRQAGKHAGGVVVLPAPVYNFVPVERAGDSIVTAFPESGSEQVLDELGIIKLDILAIKILDVIGGAIEMVDEDLYEIEEDGIIKIVPENYLKMKGVIIGEM